MRRIYFLLVMMIIVKSASAQFSIGAASTNYTQDFNGLASAGASNAWSDNTTLTGWYARTDATASIATYGANTGGTTTAGLYSYGVAATNPITERAIGWAASNAFTGASAVGKGYIGWRLVNNTGSAISSITVTWTGEQWRRENVTANSLALTYQTGATVTALTGGTWTAAPSTFASPQNSAAAGALDGNLGANRVAGISVVITVNVPAGQEIMLRWEDLNDAGNDHHLAIDDVTINASTAAGNSALSSIMHIALYTPTSNIPYHNYQATDVTLANSVELGGFHLFDGLAAPNDADALPTTLTSLTFSVTNSSILRRVALYVSGVEIAEVAAGPTITFNGLNLVAPDGSMVVFYVHATFNAPVTDKLQTVLTVTNATADPGGSTFAAANAGGAATYSNFDENRIEVVATHLAFVQNVTSPTGVNVAMTPAPTVATVDVLGSRDIDNTALIAINSTGTLSGPTSATAVAGLATFNSIVHTAPGINLSMIAQSSFNAVASNLFDIQVASGLTDHFRSAVATGNWGTAASWESSPDNATWSPSTLVPDAGAASITIRNGHNITVAAAATADQLTVATGGTLTISANFTIADGTGTDLTVNGTVVNTAGTITTTGTVAYAANSIYRHARNGSAVPSATWDVASTIEVTGVTATAPTNLAQTFGNFVWNCASQSTTANLVGTLATVAGNFRVQNTGTVSLRLTGTADLNLAVAGNFIVEASLDVDNNLTGTSAISVGGDFIQTGGTLQSSTDLATITMTGSTKMLTLSGGTYTPTNINWVVGTGALTILGADLPLATTRSVTVNSGGFFNPFTFQLTGAGDVIVNGILYTAHPNGIGATGTFANTGTSTLGAASTIVYNVNGPQTVTSRADYANLMLGLSGAKTLDGPVTVNGSLDLSVATAYLVTTATNLLTLTESATIVPGGYVDGPMLRRTNTTNPYSFPVGKAGAAHSFEVIPASTDLTSFTGEYFNAGINTTSPSCNPVRLEAYVNNEYWDISRTSGIANARIRLNYSAATSNGNWTNGSSGMANPDATKGITIAHYNATCWQDENGTPLLGSLASGQVTSRVMSSFSPFTFGYGPLTILPVSFGNIRATQQGSSVKIDWSNFTETDVLDYTVERSANGRDFAHVGIIAPRKNDGSSVDYTITDASPFNGINYYRIRSAETNGRVKYSSIVKVDLRGGRSEITLYPNPLTGNNLSLQATNLAKGQYSIKVFNATGQQVAAQTLAHNGGSITEPVQLPIALKAGLYQLLIVGEGMNVTKTFVVQ